MVDNISKEERSHIMSLVKQKDTRPEMMVRSYLHRKGLRYRLHDKRMPGKPDLVFRRYKTVVFVHGCFWHGHDDRSCKLARTPKSRVEFWINKVQRNRERDIQNKKQLEAMGWRVLTIWECELVKQDSLDLLYNTIKRSS